MKRLDYAQSVVLARVYEKRLLDRAKLERMIDASNENECFKILMDSEYSKSASGVTDVYGYVQLLNQELERTRNIADELLEDKRVLELMTIKYDYHNIKVIVKNLYVDKDLTEKLISSKNSNPLTIKAQVEADKLTNIRDEYANAVREAKDEYERTKDPQVIDIVIDRHYFEHMLALAKALDNDFFNDYICGKVDFYNVIALMRMRKMGKNAIFAERVFADGGRIHRSKLLSLLQAEIDKIILSLKGEAIGLYVVKGLEDFKKTSSLFSLEKQGNKYLNDLTKDSRFIAFGPEPIIAYILAKEKEIDNVRAIIVGKLNGLSGDRIRERLGD